MKEIRGKMKEIERAPSPIVIDYVERIRILSPHHLPSSIHRRFHFFFKELNAHHAVPFRILPPKGGIRGEDIPARYGGMLTCSAAGRHNVLLLNYYWSQLGITACFQMVAQGTELRKDTTPLKRRPRTNTVTDGLNFYSTGTHHGMITDAHTIHISHNKIQWYTTYWRGKKRFQTRTPSVFTRAHRRRDVASGRRRNKMDEKDPSLHLLSEWGSADPAKKRLRAGKTSGRCVLRKRRKACWL